MTTQEKKSELIGSGTYGCLYYPPLSCKEKELNEKYGNKDYALKVSTEEGIRDDLKLSPVLQKIDPLQQYFLYIIPKKCSLDIPKDYLMNKCIVVQKEPDKKYVGHFIKYGGIALNEYLNKYPKKITINRIWKWLIKLIYAVSLLQKERIFHGDIKINNIIIDDLDNIYLIDFGLSTIVDKLFIDFSGDFKYNFIQTFYSIYPYFWNVLKGTETQLEEEYEDRFTENNEKFINEISKKAKHIFSYEKNVIFPNIFKVDIYSLGKVFLDDIYVNFKKQLVNENKELTENFHELVISMTNPEYEKQFNVDQCLDFIKKLSIEKKIIPRLSEIYITDDEKKKALNNLCKLSKEVPKDDLIVYYDQDDKIYYCLTKDELLKLQPYYINPKNPLKFIDYKFIDKMRNYYEDSKN